MTPAWRCALGGAGLAAIAGAVSPWGLPLLWPAAALCWLGLGYAGLGPAAWGKHGGGLRRLLLLPYSLPMRVWHGRYWRRDDSPVAAAPGVWFGRRLGDGEWRGRLPERVAVLDLAPEYRAGWARRQPHYLAVDILDFTAPSPAQLERCVDFVERHRADGVYVHCALGYSRSALVIAAWMLSRDPDLAVDAACARLRASRRALVLTTEQKALLYDHGSRNT